MLPPQEQLRILREGVHEIIPLDELERKLQRSYESGKPLVVKEGFDPTAPELHIGHTITIRKLRDFQRLGHEVVFLIGDFTGLIGDPSGRSEIRKRLSREEILANAETYRTQVFKILDPVRTRVEFNSAWCESMRFGEVLDLASRYTVARLLERDDFRKRWEAQKPISLLEFMYPLVQAYDSVALRADVELGGTDQKFNLLVARDVQREYGLEPQVVMTMPILPGTDGVEKMSKSLGNHIGISEPPESIFGKTMSIPDAVLEAYLLLASDLDAGAVRERLDGIRAGKLNPSHVKRELGRDLVRQYHGEAATAVAEAAFDRIFVRHEPPEDIDEVLVEGESERLTRIMVRAGLVASHGEARRLIRQGAVQLDGVRIGDENASVDAAGLGPGVLKVGKRRFARIHFASRPTRE
ncbi:MAG: tyrosine--tRNA ligase [Candidatus Krumholzibacteriia bacterium]